MEQAIGFPMTSFPTREIYGPCWEMSLQDEHDLPERTLEHNPMGGGRKQDGLAVNRGTRHPCTQAAVKNPATRTTLMQVTGMSHSHLLFFPPKPHQAQGHAIFSPLGRGR